MAFIEINKDKRIVSANIDNRCGPDGLEVTFPNDVTFENIHDYLYDNGEWIYSPRAQESVKETVSQLDRIEAQILYTAIMTDTLMEG